MKLLTDKEKFRNEILNGNSIWRFGFYPQHSLQEGAQLDLFEPFNITYSLDQGLSEDLKDGDEGLEDDSQKEG